MTEENSGILMSIRSINICKDEVEEELSDFSSTEKLCFICLQKINIEKNNCITECGHSFCFSCMFQYCLFKKKRNDMICPVCRTPLFLTTQTSTSNDQYQYNNEEYQHREALHQHRRNTNIEENYKCRKILLFCLFVYFVIVIIVIFLFHVGVF